MTDTKNLDISLLDIQSLMQGLADQSPAPRTMIETWLVTEGYHPGSTKVLTTELHANYRIWLQTHHPAHKLENIRQFGKVLTSKFKRSRTNKQSFYYISRESLSEIQAKLAEAGPG